MLELVALGFGEDALVRPRELVGDAEVDDRRAQQLFAGAPDLGSQHARKDEVALQLLVAQLDVEILALWTGGERGKAGGHPHQSHGG
ncbi:MAG: hypothetical protein WDN31_07305 [Hyphomicrobium sp.]